MCTLGKYTFLIILSRHANSVNPTANSAHKCSERGFSIDFKHILENAKHHIIDKSSL